MAKIRKPRVEGYGSLAYEVWLFQDRKSSLSNANIHPNDLDVYMKDDGSAIAKELEIISAFGSTDGWNPVDLSYALGENKVQQVGDPTVW